MSHIIVVLPKYKMKIDTFRVCVCVCIMDLYPIEPGLPPFQYLHEAYFLSLSLILCVRLLMPDPKAKNPQHLGRSHTTQFILCVSLCCIYTSCTSLLSLSIFYSLCGARARARFCSTHTRTHSISILIYYCAIECIKKGTHHTNLKFVSFDAFSCAFRSISPLDTIAYILHSFSFFMWKIVR